MYGVAFGHELASLCVLYGNVFMSTNPFTPSLEQLPEALPIFPLPGVLLLPRQVLPLNIFEPRYLNMTTDALGAGRIIGMIQPESQDAEPPPVYRVGCAGRITAFNETNDGRFLISLTGVCRFAIADELETVRGYRRVCADWSAFRSDLAEVPELEVDFARFEQAAQAYFKARGLEVKWDVIKQLPAAALVDFLAMNLPIGGQEKQAMLETSQGLARYEVLLAVLENGRDREWRNR